jgi:hypothetical protein
VRELNRYVALVYFPDAKFFFPAPCVLAVVVGRSSASSTPHSLFHRARPRQAR